MKAGMRLRGLVRKESLQILRDPSSIAIAFVMPVVLLLLFGFGVSLDARNIRLALVVEQADANTTSLVGAFRSSEFFLPSFYTDMQQAEQVLASHQVDGIVWLRNDFTRRLLTGGEAPIGGKLPVTIPDLYPAGHGFERAPLAPGAPIASSAPR